jgi:O-acetyl-ADP-ribose deacetylase (regulator of RNase III)
MLYEHIGDLLTSDCNVFIHQVNAQGVMGSGIAKQIRQQFPQVYIDYMEAYHKHELKLGIIICTATRGKYIYSICAQEYYGRQGKYTDENAFTFCMGQVTGDLYIKDLLATAKIGLPYGIGCGLGGADIKVINGILNMIATQYQINLHLYKLGGSK